MDLRRVAALGRPLSVLTVLLAPTLLAAGSVFGVHVIGRYEEEARHAATPREAIRARARTLIAPVLISGVTTAIGFGSLCITDVPAVFELGAFSVLGVAAVTLLTLTLRSRRAGAAAAARARGDAGSSARGSRRVLDAAAAAG